MSDMVSVAPCPNKHPHGAHEWSSPLNINGTRFSTNRCEGVTAVADSHEGERMSITISQERLHMIAEQMERDIERGASEVIALRHALEAAGVEVERPLPPEPEGDVIVEAVSKALDESRGRRYLFSRGPDGWYSRSTMGATPWEQLTSRYGEIKVYRAEES